MVAAAAPATSRGRLAPVSGRPATQVAVAWFGALAGLAGIEHGLGEILQGNHRPDGLLIASWPDAAALQVLSGEPALTVVPDIRMSGILTIVVGLALAVWAVGFAARRHGGWVLVALSVLLLLVGGGLAPPLMGVALGAVATRIGVPSRTRPGAVARALAPAWPWLLATTLFGYLALMPGMLLATAWGVASEGLVLALATVAFAGFGLTLTAARAQDRLRTTVT